MPVTSFSSFVQRRASISSKQVNRLITIINYDLEKQQILAKTGDCEITIQLDSKIFIDFQFIENNPVNKNLVVYNMIIDENSQFYTIDGFSSSLPKIKTMAEIMAEKYGHSETCFTQSENLRSPDHIVH